MAKVTIKGRKTTGRRDLMKQPYTQEELQNYEKGLLRFTNTSLTKEEFDCKYHTAPSVERIMKIMKSTETKAKSLDEMLELLSAGLIMALGAGCENLAYVGYPVDKQADLKWESRVLQKVWERVFNPNKVSNCYIDGVARYIWLEEIAKPLITCDIITDTKEMSVLISELRGICDIFIKEKITDTVNGITGVLAGLELLLKEFLMHNITVFEKNVVCKPGFFQKFWNTICEYKWWIAAYAGVAAIVYFGIAAFSIPVAGEIWTMGNAAAATAVETVGVTVGVGVTGAVLL